MNASIRQRRQSKEQLNTCLCFRYNYLDDVHDNRPRKQRQRETVVTENSP